MGNMEYYTFGHILWYHVAANLFKPVDPTGSVGVSHGNEHFDQGIFADCRGIFISLNRCASIVASIIYFVTVSF